MATPVSYAHVAESQRPYTSPQDFYRLRDFGQKFEATIGFLRKHGGNLYRVLLVPLLLALVPLVVIAALFANSISSSIFQGASGSGFGAGLALMIPAIILLGLLILGALMAQYVMLYGFVKCRMWQPDPAIRISAGEAWNAGKRYLLPLIGYSIVAGLGVLAVMLPVVFGMAMLGKFMIFFGVLLMIVPAVYLMIVLLMLPSVVVFEDADLMTTFRRCFTLVRGKWWSTFGLYMVASLAVGMVAGGIGVVISIVGMAFSFKEPGSTAAIVAMAVSQAVQLGINFLLYPVLYVLLMFQYFNLVERHDHVSLQWQAEQLGQTPGGPATPGAASIDDTLFRPSYGDQTL